MNKLLDNFGPWTTSLDSSSRMQLSAFWKQRMRRLPELALARRGSKRLIALMGVLVTIVCVSPLVELVPAAPTVAAVESDFVADFSNGASVELIGVSENPSANAKWWKPDGTPLEKRPYQKVRAKMESAGSLAREVCWRWRGLNGDMKTNWATEPTYNGAGGGLLSNEHVEGLDARAISLAGTPDTCTVKLSISVPATPWETQVETQAGNSSSTGQVLRSGQSASVSFMVPRADGNDTVVVVGYKIPGEARLAALDTEGITHIGRSTGGTSANGFAMREVRFANLSPAELKTWQLQTRQRKTETVEFRNVSLHRGKVTDVETVSGAEAIGKREGEDADIALVSDKDPLQERMIRIEEERAPLLLKIAAHHGYSLNPKQFVRRIVPPFPPQRFLSFLAGRSDHEKANVHPPDAMFFRWENESLRLAITNYGGENLAGIINHVAGIKSHELEGQEELLKTKVVGDWVVRQGADTKDVLSDLEAILRDECQVPLQLQMRMVEREVYVARGDYQFKPLPGYPQEEMHFRVHRTFTTDPLEVFGKDLFSANQAGNGTGDLDDFLRWVGDWTNALIINEVQAGPTRELSWEGHRKNPYSKQDEYESSNPALVLPNIAKQTGLNFTKDIRNVEILFVERDE